MALRRNNGTGTIYKLKNPRLRKPWRVMITTGYSDDGRQLRKSLGTYRTLNEARAVLRDYEITPELMRYADLKVEDAWLYYLYHKKAEGVSASRMKDIESTGKKLEPLFKMDVQDVRTLHLQSVIDQFAEGYSKSYIQVIKTTYVNFFEYLVKNDIVIKNHAKNVIIPASAIDSPNKHTPFTNEEVQTLWANASDPIVQLILIYIYTGMRANELIKMEIDNVNIKERYMVGGSKTKAGKNRVIPIHKSIYPFILDLVSKARFKQSTTLDIEPYSKLQRQFIATCTKYGIARHTMHDTRHTFISMCSTARIDPTITRKVVGHARNDITEDIYTHKHYSELVAAIDTLPHGIDWTTPQENKA